MARRSLRPLRLVLRIAAATVVVMIGGVMRTGMMMRLGRCRFRRRLPCGCGLRLGTGRCQRTHMRTTTVTTSTALLARAAIGCGYIVRHDLVGRGLLHRLNGSRLRPLMARTISPTLLALADGTIGHVDIGTPRSSRLMSSMLQSLRDSTRLRRCTPLGLAAPAGTPTFALTRRRPLVWRPLAAIGVCHCLAHRAAQRLRH